MNIYMYKNICVCICVCVHCANVYSLMIKEKQDRQFCSSITHISQFIVRVVWTSRRSLNVLLCLSDSHMKCPSWYQGWHKAFCLMGFALFSPLLLPLLFYLQKNSTGVQVFREIYFLTVRIQEAQNTEHDRIIVI